MAEPDSSEGASQIQEKEKSEATGSKSKRKKKEPEKRGILGGAAELVPVLILGYAAYISKFFYANLYPTFPDFDANHNYLEKFGNRLEAGEELFVRAYVKESKSQPVIPAHATPDWETSFKYAWEEFVPLNSSKQANVTQKLLESNKNIWLVARLFTKTGEKIAEAYGKMVKYTKLKPVPTKYWMLSGGVCDEGAERAYGTKSNPMTARGIPKMQVRVVYDRTLYPRGWKHAPYYPMMYVDEFWLTDDQLVKFNATGTTQFDVDMQLDLMSDARWRFQHMMDHSFTQNAKLFGDDSEELMAMRDMFANTHPYLLIATLVVSVLHCIFEYLALKSDVSFWKATDAKTLSRFISLRAVVLEILCNVVLMVYLYDQDSNFLVLVLSGCQVLVDCWKVTRVVEVTFQRKYVVIPWPCFKSRVPNSSDEDYDKTAMKYLSIILLPVIVSYACYSVTYECHKSWMSYVLHVSATMVYALGFALMTPQLFINYRMKSVANLPWRRFIYRAINTFIDDLFAFIIKMPTMHRMSCFRDDFVFIAYLYQRHIYPVDTNRNFDEDIVEVGDDATDEGKKTK